MVDQVEEVKSKTDIVAVIGSYVPLKKAGKNYKGNCPFHAEKSPSFMVSPELQIYKCFGCGETGDVISFLEKHEGMEFFEALEFLAKKLGIELAPLRSGSYSQNERIYKTNELISRFYSYLLLNHKTGKYALSYLTQERGLKIDTIKKFAVGFSPDDTRIFSKFTMKRKVAKNDLLNAGLVFQRGNELIDRFYGRVTFPLHDHRGNIVGFSGRLLPNSKKEMAKYINTPETSAYHKSRILYGLNFTKSNIKEEGYAVVAEGELDMISSWQAGVKNIVAIKGSALTDDHVRLISRFTSRIVLALDSDFAGDMAARRGISNASNSGLEILVADLGDYKDPDDMARENPNAYKQALTKAKNIWDYLISSTLAKYDIESGTGKQKISGELVPVLRSIEDSIVQAHYIEKLAKLLNVPSEAIYEEVGKKRDQEKPVSKEVDSNVPKDRRFLLEEQLMSMIFQANLLDYLSSETVDIIKTNVFKRILEEYEIYIKKYKFDSSDFAKSLPKELFQAYSDLILNDLASKFSDQKHIEDEIEVVLREIAIIDLKEKLTQNILHLKKAESEKNGEKLKKLQNKLNNLTKKISELEEVRT